MLVDPARNDLARIWPPSGRYVADLTKVDRYSFVMRLVSRVVGELRSDLDVLHAYRAGMNMGILERRAESTRHGLSPPPRQTPGGSYWRRGGLLLPPTATSIPAS